MRQTRHFTLLPILLSALAGTLALSRSLIAVPLPGTQPRQEMVPMRDGVRLATDVYRPTKIKGEMGMEGPWGVVLLRTPYNKANAGPWIRVTRRGMVLVVQDVRGRYASEGKPQPFADDGWGQRQDGLDTVRWIRQQPWCNGRIVTEGGSAGALTQILLAAAGPEKLAGQHLTVGTMSLYHDGFYQGGVFRKSLVERWLVSSQWPPHCLEVIRQHPYYDDYWRSQNLGEQAERVDWPMAMVGGWYDIFQQGTLDLFQAIHQRGGPEGRNNVHLIMGPWTHAVGRTQVGDLAFPENAKWDDRFPRFDQWVGHWLLDEPLKNDVPAVLYYTMGPIVSGKSTGGQPPGNTWRTAASWPPAAKTVPFYLTPQGTLQMLSAPQSGQFTYRYDPSQPVPTHGGPNLLIPAGSYDQREIEQRGDVLVFSSEPLIRPLEVTGRVRARLAVATSAADTDFTAKLTDVYPDGRSMLLVDGICRLSLRDRLEQPSEVTPGKTYRIEVDLWSTSYVFGPGHRIRLAISSSNSPRLEPHSNRATGDQNPAVAAEQTLYVGGEQASCLQLPVVE